eukprot:SAG31_NODE_27830_length_419_cov_1.128125_2_plen_47_part_01
MVLPDIMPSCCGLSQTVVQLDIFDAYTADEVRGYFLVFVQLFEKFRT